MRTGAVVPLLLLAALAVPSSASPVADAVDGAAGSLPAGPVQDAAYAAADEIGAAEDEAAYQVTGWTTCEQAVELTFHYWVGTLGETEEKSRAVQTVETSRVPYHEHITVGANVPLNTVRGLEEVTGAQSVEYERTITVTRYHEVEVPLRVDIDWSQTFVDYEPVDVTVWIAPARALLLAPTAPIEHVCDGSPIYNSPPTPMGDRVSNRYMPDGWEVTLLRAIATELDDSSLPYEDTQFTHAPEEIRPEVQEVVQAAADRIAPALIVSVPEPEAPAPEPKEVEVHVTEPKSVNAQLPVGSVVQASGLGILSLVGLALLRKF